MEALSLKSTSASKRSSTACKTGIVPQWPVLGQGMRGCQWQAFRGRFLLNNLFCIMAGLQAIKSYSGHAEQLNDMCRHCQQYQEWIM